MDVLPALIEAFLAKTALKYRLVIRFEPVRSSRMVESSYTDFAECYLCNGCGDDLNVLGRPRCLPCEGLGVIFR